MLTHGDSSSHKKHNLTIHQQHGVNMNTSLLTFDGFPRNDIDVAQIRTTRARIIHLKTDYKLVMAELEKAVHDRFAQGADSSSQATPSANIAARSAVPTTADSTLEPPFAKINTIVSNSPAELAGLLVGDKVTRFGTVNFTNHERLGKVAQVVQQSENVSWITLGVQRRGC